MEKVQEKSKLESDEFVQKHKSIMSQKLIENCVNEPKIVESNEQNEKNGTFRHDPNGHEEIIKNDIPPKPLPRKSISEQGSFEENSTNIIPKPRPRTACPSTNYKVQEIYI